MTKRNKNVHIRKDSSCSLIVHQCREDYQEEFAWSTDWKRDYLKKIVILLFYIYIYVYMYIYIYNYQKERKNDVSYRTKFDKVTKIRAD